MFADERVINKCLQRELAEYLKIEFNFPICGWRLGTEFFKLKIQTVFAAASEVLQKWLYQLSQVINIMSSNLQRLISDSLSY